ncbi:MAG: YicC/YloC family endoribonuclease [Woeseiaceae bacterium]|nr:YicC/YloC family endoribonuclease [Woeseiaceae bacterium]
MTGFARQIAETPMGTLTCELRAVNHRYLDVSFRLPEELRVKEGELKTRVAAVIKRGKIECNLHWTRSRNDADDLALDHERLGRIADRVAEVRAAMPQCGEPDPLDVLRWPGILVEPPVDADPLYEQACTVLDGTVGALDAARRSEGARIEEMLQTRCDEIRRIGSGVRQRMPEVLASVRQRMKDRLDKLDVSADPERLETELALVAQKLDVDEELDRLESHVVEILDVLGRAEPVGRRLDFLMQELNREANTLGSKSADPETTRAAVELKVLIEQMREQVQNVE